MIVLDCCRTNVNNETFKDGTKAPQWTPGVPGDNLRSDQYKCQYLVSFACEPGTSARSQVGNAQLSPFTDARLPPLREGVPLQAALDRATTVVARATGNTQRPSYRCSLERDAVTGAPLVL